MIELHGSSIRFTMTLCGSFSYTAVQQFNVIQRCVGCSDALPLAMSPCDENAIRDNPPLTRFQVSELECGSLVDFVLAHCPVQLLSDSLGSNHSPTTEVLAGIPTPSDPIPQYAWPIEITQTFCKDRRCADRFLHKDGVLIPGPSKGCPMEFPI